MFLKTKMLTQSIFEMLLNKADHFSCMLSLITPQDSIISPISEEIVLQAIDICEHEDINIIIKNFPFPEFAFLSEEHIQANRAYFQEIIKEIKDKAIDVLVESSATANKNMIYRFFGVNHNENNHPLGELEILNKITNYIV